VNTLLSLLRAFVLVAPLAAGCTCTHGSEPDKAPGFDPTSPDGLAKAPPTPSEQANMTEQEFRDFRVHVAHDLCDLAFEHINVIDGKDPTDPNNVHAKMLRGACITEGNNAWYKCQLAAQTKEDLRVCNNRFMPPPK
jgi:hypothetical protein